MLYKYIRREVPVHRHVNRNRLERDPCRAISAQQEQVRSDVIMCGILIHIQLLVQAQPHQRVDYVRKMRGPRLQSARNLLS